MATRDASTTAINSRNNNPLNIRDTIIPWQGAIGSNGGFETFSNPEYGFRAAAKNLYTSQETHGNDTLAKVITRWAPPSENDTAAYIARVAADTGVDPNAVIDLKNDPALTKSLIESMTKHEGGGMGKFDVAQIESGIALANDKPGSEIEFSKQDTDHNPDEYTSADDTAATTIAPQERRRQQAFQDPNSTNSKNWMSTVDSPTYRWTLYIVNNEVMNDPTMLHSSDSAAINSNKAKIIAMQGVTTQFTLDNFMMLSTVTPGQSYGNTTPGIIQFDLFESLGFTFLDRTLRAGIAMGNSSSLYTQNYILKLEFLGRDPKTAASTKFPGVFFYPVKLNQIRSSTGPEGTRYNIVAWSMIKHAQTNSVTSVDFKIDNITTVGSYATGFETGYNDAEISLLEPQKYSAGLVWPDREIKIEFAASAKSVGTVNGKVVKNLKHFTLETNMYGGAAATTSGANLSPGHPGNGSDGIDTREENINIHEGIGPRIAEDIQKNCPAWADWCEHASTLGVTPSIVVELGHKIRLNNAGDEMGQGYHETTVTTFSIHINLSLSGYNVDAGIAEELVNDQEFQVDLFNLKPIMKNYTFLYSGLNTEVLNYQIDIESLYTVIDIPVGGVYMRDGRQQFTGTSPIAITNVTSAEAAANANASVNTSASSARFLEDIDFGTVHGGLNQLANRIKMAPSIDDQNKGESNKDQTQTYLQSANLAKREYDALNFNMEIKGDPFWMGTMTCSIEGRLEVPNYNATDALISFIQYNPNASDLLENQRRGPVDLISSGVYKLTTIESKFQGGQFTQTLNGFKDLTTNTSLVLGQLQRISGE